MRNGYMDWIWFWFCFWLIICFLIYHHIYPSIFRYLPFTSFIYPSIVLRWSLSESHQEHQGLFRSVSGWNQNSRIAASDGWMQWEQYLGNEGIFLPQGAFDHCHRIVETEFIWIWQVHYGTWWTCLLYEKSTMLHCASVSRGSQFCAQTRSSAFGYQAWEYIAIIVFESTSESDWFRK